MEAAAETLSWIEYQATAEDFVKAYQLQRSPRRKTRLVATATWSIIFCVTICLTSKDISTAIFATFVVIPIFFTVYAGFVWVALQTMVPRQARRIYKNYPLAQKPHWLAFRPEALYARNEQAEATHPWSNFIKWRENREVILAYLAPNIFFIIPTRLASQGFPIEDLKGALYRQLGAAIR